MPKTSTLTRRGNTRQHIKQGYRNVVKCSKDPAETTPHRVMKMFICEKLYACRAEFQTEATLYHGGRCDIIVEDWGVIIEVLHSESMKKFNRKKYPLPTIPVYSDEQLSTVELMITELYLTSGSVAEGYIKLMKEKYEVRK